MREAVGGRAAVFCDEVGAWARAERPASGKAAESGWIQGRTKEEGSRQSRESSDGSAIEIADPAGRAFGESAVCALRKCAPPAAKKSRCALGAAARVQGGNAEPREERRHSCGRLKGDESSPHPTIWVQCPRNARGSNRRDRPGTGHGPQPMRRYRVTPSQVSASTWPRRCSQRRCASASPVAIWISSSEIPRRKSVAKLS